MKCCFLKSISYGVNILGICKIYEFTHAMKKYKNNLFRLSTNYVFKILSEKYWKTKAYGFIRSTTYLAKINNCCLLNLLYWTEVFLEDMYIVGNKTKGQISKRVLQGNKARQIFRKTKIFYPVIGMQG